MKDKTKRGEATILRFRFMLSCRKHGISKRQTKQNEEVIVRLVNSMTEPIPTHILYEQQHQRINSLRIGEEPGVDRQKRS